MPQISFLATIFEVQLAERTLHLFRLFFPFIKPPSTLFLLLFLFSLRIVVVAAVAAVDVFVLATSR